MLQRHTQKSKDRKIQTESQRDRSRQTHRQENRDTETEAGRWENRHREIVDRCRRKKQRNRLRDTEMQR